MRTVRYNGTIKTITRDGRSGVVILDNPASGKGYAVISPDTQGRIRLIQRTGRLTRGMRVTGTAEEGSEALRALTVDAD